MEINSSVSWLDKDHPNYERWKRGRELSIERGKFVHSLISKNLSLKNLTILDLGSGEGGTSWVFSEKFFLISCDYNLIRLKRHSDNFDKINYVRINSDATKLPFRNNSYDLIILQDVIEHIEQVHFLIEEIIRTLKPNGQVYLSTPNKFSLFNIISDPHWGLPFLALFSRHIIRNFYLKIFRKNEVDRKDIAQLFSLNELTQKFKNSFDISLYTKFAVKELFDGNKGIVWSNFHIFLLKAAKKLKMNKLILKFANDKMGLVNKFFTPTFYMILRKL